MRFGAIIEVAIGGVAKMRRVFGSATGDFFSGTVCGGRMLR